MPRAISRLKQMSSGAFMIGGGWTAGLDEQPQAVARAAHQRRENFGS